MTKELLRCFKPPFSYDSSGYIFDSKSQMVAEVRGWGYLQYFPDGEKLQDELGEIIAKSLTHCFNPDLQTAEKDKRIKELENKGMRWVKASEPPKSQEDESSSEHVFVRFSGGQKEVAYYNWVHNEWVFHMEGYHPVTEFQLKSMEWLDESFINENKGKGEEWIEKINKQIEFSNQKQIECDENGDSAGEQAWFGYTQALRWVLNPIPPQ